MTLKGKKMVARKRWEDDFEQYKTNLKYEAIFLKHKLRGKAFYRPDQNRDENGVQMPYRKSK